MKNDIFKYKLMIATFVLVVLSVQSQVSTVAILSDTRHRCCSSGFTTTGADGLPESYRVVRCSEVLGNSSGSSQAAYEDACSKAQYDAARLRNLLQE